MSKKALANCSPSAPDDEHNSCATRKQRARTSECALYDAEVGYVAQEVGVAGRIWVALLSLGRRGLAVAVGVAVDAVDLDHLGLVRRRARRAVGVFVVAHGRR